MRKLSLLVTLLAFLSLAIGWATAGNAESSKSEKTLNYDGSKITVKTLAKGVEVISVKPYIKAKKGKKKGSLWLDVILKNTGTEAQSYSVWGKGITKTGGWLGGSVKRFPKKTKIAPGEEKKAKVRTRYKGVAVPKEIIVEIWPPL
jgi:hypothetical protein